MNVDTGKILSFDAINGLPLKDRNRFVPIRRDLTPKEICDQQIRLYAPCGCGSGKKFKFCCRGKAK